MCLPPILSIGGRRFITQVLIPIPQIINNGGRQMKGKNKFLHYFDKKGIACLTETNH